MCERSCRTVKMAVCFVLSVVFLLFLCPAVNIGAAGVQTVNVGVPVDDRSELFFTHSMPSRGDAGIAVFLIDFPDLPNTNPAATRDYYDKLFFKGGLDTIWGDMHVSRFFDEQSFGKLKVGGEVFDWYRAKHERSYYDDRKNELITEAVQYYLDKGVDLSGFDGNGDGVLDSVIFYFTGAYSGDMTDSWYHGVEYSTDIQLGNFKITTIIQMCESASEGRNNQVATACHELMHALGMPDLYSGGDYMCTPVHCLLAGDHMTVNPFIKILLGWVDNVKVVTSDTKNVRVDLYGTSENDIVIVTDEFNGFFDEFFVVSYRPMLYGTGASVIRVDARPNENGSGFMNDNFLYSPRPDNEKVHGLKTFSPHLFIEELSGDPAYDHLLNLPYNGSVMHFNEKSVLGPNSMPSSDWHDGTPSGVRMENFKEHGGEYITFDVSFVKDTAAPIVTTEETKLAFSKTVKLKLNEHVYEGANFKNIKITDLDGNRLDATVILPFYPKNEIEITFADNSYEKGYKVILPEDSVHDSSGNKLKAITLTASPSKRLTPLSTKELPKPNGSYRGMSMPWVFKHEDSMVIVSSLPLGTNYSGRVELMRVDYSGNVISHAVLNNPFEEGRIDYVIPAIDGSYIFLGYEPGAQTRRDLIFCVDGNGELRWANSDYQGSGRDFFGTVGARSLAIESGVVLVDQGEMKCVLINHDTGAVSEMGITPDGNINDFFDLTGGIMLYICERYENGSRYKILEIVDAKTREIKVSGAIPISANDMFIVERARKNDNGTYTLICISGMQREAYLLDSELNVIKSVTLGEMGAINECPWLEDGGFVSPVILTMGGHSDSLYNIKRYDANLNLLWETEVECYSASFFLTPSGEVASIRTSIRNGVEIFVDNYGSEEEYRITHVHSIMRVAEIPATCISEGVIEHLRCSECGEMYIEGQSTPISADALVIPKTEHITEILGASEPTCTSTGLTEGSRCAVCKTVFVAQNTVPTVPHTYGDWTVSAQPTHEKEGEEYRACTSCGEKETRAIPKTEKRTEPLTEPVTEPVTEPKTEPATEPKTEPITEPATEPKTEPATEPVTDKSPAGEEKSGSVSLIIIVAAVVVIVLCVAAVIIHKRKKN